MKFVAAVAAGAYALLCAAVALVLFVALAAMSDSTTVTVPAGATATELLNALSNSPCGSTAVIDGNRIRLRQWKM